MANLWYDHQHKTLVASNPQRNSLYFLRLAGSSFTYITERALPHDTTLLSINISDTPEADTALFDIPIAHTQGFTILRVRKDLIMPIPYPDAPLIDSSLLATLLPPIDEAADPPDEKKKGKKKAASPVLTNGKQKIADEMVAFESSLLKSLSSLLTSSLEDQESSRRSTQSLYEANQSTLLKLVSETLTENTGKILKDTITSGLQNIVLPRHLQDDSAALSESILQPLSRDLLKLSTSLDAQLATMRAHQIERDQAFSAKIDRILSALQRIESALPPNLNGHSLVKDEPSTPSIDSQRISDYLLQHKHEDAIVVWIQSDEREDLFRFFHPLSPSIIDQCSQVVLLSLAHTIAVNLETQLQDKLRYLERALTLIDPENAQIAEVANDIIRLIEQQLVSISGRLTSGDITLRHIKALHRYILGKFHHLE
ncbi:hypothetical protein NEOLI_003485 [Neolecta irregularis DAH-3]|uniref:Enhancer of mRNA-decapping protein 4 C-terminal domain-containing protein n=1 Tax=Neolecta irregularis (strain DAH-3) TaxID=1198029 RepID=A0A1U7LJ79_NEOID|nr:hypothetical protein NEOLI_003485 [Neolecta irregularis DAH-3]|eukprot:OLL22581.1 hypothetical protein NEOLI_003485 [Neolecta irregularis DAH-3]